MDSAEEFIHGNTNGSVVQNIASGAQGSPDPLSKDPTEQADSFLQQHGGQIHEALNVKDMDPTPEQLTFSRQTTLE